MKRYMTLGYGAAAYLLFLAAFLYLIGFVGNLAVPRSVDRGPAAPIAEAMLINAALVVLFGVQHSVMARPAFKRWWARFVPSSIERSTYVLLSSVVLALLYWQWRTMPTVIWDVQVPAARAVLWVLFWLGWAIALLATFLINHFDLFGLRQVYLASRQKPYTSVEFRVRLLYRAGASPADARDGHRVLGGADHDGRASAVLDRV